MPTPEIPLQEAAIPRETEPQGPVPPESVSSELVHTTHIAWVSNVQFDPSLRAGALHSFLGRLRFLDSLGYRVSIIDFLIDENIHQGFDQALEERGGKPVHSKEDGICRTVFQGVPYCHRLIPCQGREELFSNPTKIADAMIPFLQEEKVDFTITTDQGYAALFAAWKLMIPGAHFFNARINIKTFSENPLYVRLLSRRTVVANSFFMRDEVKRYMGLDAHVWFPFVDPERLRFKTPESWKSDSKPQRIGFYAFRGIKGSPIVDAVAEILPEYEFLVVGSTGDYRMKNKHGNIRLLGFIDDMGELYRNIDIMLVPSTVKDALPRVITEASLNGIPVIANRVGGIPDALEDSGVLIDVKNSKNPDIPKLAKNYAQEIRRLLESKAVLTLYEEKARARAESYVQEQEDMGREFVRRFVEGI